MSKLNSQLNEQSIPLLSETRFATWSQKIQKPKNVTEETSIFFNACFDKGHVKELVSWFLNQYGEKPTIIPKIPNAICTTTTSRPTPPAK